MTSGAAALGGDAPLRYSRMAMILHWLIAAMIVANLFLGFFHEDFAKPARAAMMWWHKSLGFSILALTLVRLGWRLGHRPPPFDPVLKAWEVTLARAAHWLFYVLLLVIPISGWLLVSTSGRATSFFGLFDIGALPISRARDVHELFEEMHELLGYAMLALLTLHVVGALKHHFEGHRHLMGRMAPWVRAGAPPPRP